LKFRFESAWTWHGSLFQYIAKEFLMFIVILEQMKTNDKK